jgi:peptide/nickel transport system substrate-binding protein
MKSIEEASMRKYQGTAGPFLGALSLWVLCGGLSLGLAGCAQAKDKAIAAPVVSASAFKPVFLTVNEEQQSTWVRNFNPFSPDTRMQASQGMIYEPMMIFNKATNELVPWLATGYTWNKDFSSLVFKLRKGVKWSDGKDFTAKDVVYTFDLLKGNQSLVNNIGSILSDNLESWTAKDDLTVEFKFKIVHTPALYIIADELLVPEHIWKDVKDPVAFTNPSPVGTGPFTEVTKFEDQIYVIEKNPHYWQPGRPAYQGVRFPAYPGNDQANLALANGELDWASNFVPDADKTFVAKNPKDFHYYFVGGDPVMLYLNPAVKPFGDPAVRKALSMAINREMMVDVAEFNYVAPLDTTGLSEEYKAWKDPTAAGGSSWTRFDAKAAGAELDRLGYKKGPDGLRKLPDGKSMKFVLLCINGWTDWISACQIIAQNLKDIGVSVDLQTPEQNTWQEDVGKGKFQMAIGWSSGGATPYNFYRGQMSKLTVKPVGTDAGENWSRIAIDAADQALDEFARTADAARQKELMNKLQEIFVENAPALPLFPGPDWYEYSTARFTGFPTKEKPYAPGPMYSAPSISLNALLVYTSLQPK